MNYNELSNNIHALWIKLVEIKNELINAHITPYALYISYCTLRLY